MNILHYSPGLRPGSISQLAADLAAGLQDAGFTNTVVSPPNELVGALTAARVEHRPARSKPTLFTLRGVLKRLRGYISEQQSDIVYAYGPQATRLALLALRRSPAKDRPRLVSVMTGFPQRILRTRALPHCDAVVAVSRFLRREISRIYTLPENCGIWSIPYGVHEEYCNPLYRPTEEWQDQWQKAHPQPPGTLSLCVPAAISPIHGQHLLPELLNLLIQQGIKPRVYLAGDTVNGNAAYQEKLRQQFEETGAEQYITWLGLRRDLRDVLCNCHISLSLSLAPASHDRAILEALSLGCPVIGFDHGAVGEMLSTFLPEGRVQPANITAMADTITQWVALRPDTITAVPYPYRFQDTVRSYAELCLALLS
ncbi:MAG: glycosyltransferase family 4 protein [Akkermansia sp.]|nr:glycosyltransferase family 4 protein [Akkermansia sp.]